MSARRHASLALGAFVASAVGSLHAACKSTPAADDPKICTPNNYVFCRCENRSEGTKHCQASGTAFDDCKCDGSNPPDPDSGFNAVDASIPDADAGDAAAPNDLACAGKLLVIGGNAGTLYVAIYNGNGKFTVAASSGAAASIKGAPAVIPLESGGFGAVYRNASDALYDVTFGASLTAPVRIGTVTASDAPSLAAVAGGLRLVYRGGDGLHYYGSFNAGVWDGANSAITSASVHSFGPSSPVAVVPAGGALTVAYAGGDQKLYRQTLTNSWDDASAVSGATTATTRPQIVTLTGARDLLVVYANAGDYKLRFATRTANGGAWSVPVQIDPNVYTTEPISLAPMSNGRAMLVYRGANLKPYFSVYDPAAGGASPWSVIAELVAGANPTVASSPAVFAGACGEDAVLTFAQDNGAVAVQRYVAGAWSQPALIPGLLNFTDVGVAERH